MFIASSRVALIKFVPKRAMASAAKPPSQPPPTSSSDNENNDETQLAKKEGSVKDFVNYNDTAGYKRHPYEKDTYFNPLLTPPPRSPSTPEDFRYPHRLGHWQPIGFDYTSPVADTYYYHEYLFAVVCGGILTLWGFKHIPDYKDREWAKREAFLRTAKREALGIPLIDKDVVPVERVVLPTEEELGDFEVTM